MSNLRYVLLVEDDRMIAKSLQLSLPYKGFEVIACESFEKGLRTFQSRLFDIVLLDVNLPDGNGVDLCRQIRKTNKKIPILMVTAQTDEASAIQGLEGGADDYIRKPYGVQELCARMTRLLGKTKEDGDFLEFGEIRVDPKKHMAWVNEIQLSLGKREMEILTLLVKKKGEVVTRNDILTTLGEEVEIYDRTIDSHLSHLRKKLKDAGLSQLQIVPVYGVGYRLDSK